MVGVVGQEYEVRVSRSRLGQLREQVVEAVGRGIGVGEVGRVLGVPRSTAYRWVMLARDGGAEALEPKVADRSGTRKLTPSQERELAGVIAETDPRVHGYASALWSRSIIADWVAGRWGVDYTPQGIGIVLHRLGLSAQRPIVRAGEASAERQDAWRAVQYPAIAEQAAVQDATVLFIDEAGVRSDYHSGTTWAPVGKTPIVKGTGARLSVNMVSAVAATGALYFDYLPPRVGSAAFCAFLALLLTVVAGPIIAIVDGHPAHRAAATKAFVAAHADRLALHFLPGYSPMLNPDEWVWKNIKHDVVGKLAARAREVMKTAIDSAVARLHASPDIVRGFFADPDLTYITSADTAAAHKSHSKLAA